MKIIGIICRKGISNEYHNINIVYTNIVNAIKRNGGIPIGIILDSDYKQLIDICDGVIFSGGDDFEEYDLSCLKYIYDNDIPVLGICLGMQLMGYLFNGNLKEIDNHKSKLNYVHSVNINKDSILYKIIGKEKIKVNSRHKYIIENTILFISSRSSDGYIESIECKNKKFFIGVQWHPEDMIEYDIDQNNLFKYFISCC